MSNVTSPEVKSVLAALLREDMAAGSGRFDLAIAIVRAALKTARSAEERTALRLTLSALRKGGA